MDLTFGIFLLTLCNLAIANISIVSTDPSRNRTIVKHGDSTTLSCRTDRKWFFCLWTSPGGDRQCAIQENEPSQVCKGDSRLVLSGSKNSCDLSISNMNAADWGDWMCLVNDDINFSTDRKHIALEVGSPGAISLISDPALTSDLFDHSSDLDLDLQPQQFDLQQPEVETNILRLTEGQQGRIDCAVRGAYPAPTISWSGPTPGPSYGGVDRVNRNVGTQSMMDSQFRGNITVIQEGLNEISADGRTINSVSSILYSSHINDTNSTIRCEMSQVDGLGRILYSSSRLINILVDPLPVPEPVISYATKIGIVSGVVFSSLFLLLLCILLTLFMCRRERRRKAHEHSEHSERSEYQINPIWTTDSSKSIRQLRDDGFQENGVGYSGSRFESNHPIYLHEPRSGSRDGSIESADTTRSANAPSDESDQTGRNLPRAQRDFLARRRPEDFRTNSKDSSKRSSASYETERSIAEMESGSVIFNPAVTSLQGSVNLTFGSVQGSTHLNPAPSLHETHFGVGGADSPLTILHPPGMMSRPGTVEPYYDPPWRKISSTKSEGGAGAGGYMPRYQPVSRPASTLGVYLLPDSRQPQRLSTPTCPGSLLDHRSTSSVFQCPHDCFILEEPEHKLGGPMGHLGDHSFELASDVYIEDPYYPQDVGVVPHGGDWAPHDRQYLLEELGQVAEEIHQTFGKSAKF